ncbi:20351_t:CDS:2, partial [Dentiscutata erythropus]
MLVPKHNILSSEHLIACERTMLKFVDGKLNSKVGMEFKVWDWQIPELYGIVLGMFVKLGLKETLGIRKSEMLDFIIDVEKGYYKTSYHSFYHAVDVVAVLYYMLKDLGAGTRPSVITTLDSEQRELLLKILLHAADLSNTVRPWDISKRWSDLVVEEFFHQGDLEKQNNLPVSPNMDRKKAHQCQISLGFGDFVVKPFFEAFASFLHQATIFLDILAENRIYWDDMKNAPPQPPPTLLTPSSDDDDTSSSLDDNYSKGQRRVSLAAGLLIIPDDIQEKLRLMASQRHTKNHKKLKRSLSGRSYSHHALLPAHPDSSPPSLIITPVSSDAIINSTSTNSHYTNGKKANNNHQKRLGRMRRSSSLDHNMIRQITSLCGTGDSQPEQRVVVAG